MALPSWSLFCCFAAEQRKALDQEIGKFGGGLKTMIRAAGGRYLGMDNKASPAKKEQQLQDLIRMMQVMCSDNMLNNICDPTSRNESHGYFLRF